MEQPYHRPQKRFGQNFLHDDHVIDRILAAADLSSADRVLEIGPGLGVLTDRMLPKAGHVVVMEVDRNLVERLKKRIDSNLTVFEGDALHLDWKSILCEPPYKLVANLPYNISSQILFKLLDHRDLFSRLVLMFQKEVGDRLAAAPGTRDYGILSVLCQVWFDVRKVVNVPPGAFKPPPKVHSIVLEFHARREPRVAIDDPDFFRKVVKASFAQRRKTLRNTLTGSGFSADNVDVALSRCGIDPGRRGETLSLAEFSQLARELKASFNS
ncbi:16S rRNA (adenine(1518)-N(6)/adenine(1519)-N(6))-dimethyltransferase RsmA [Desulfuromonas sp. AOP6]|uniref:16S rRNA (adenine(1518)-N(6)/adenine(1519)-N(6))- dimethyltransferase RsmA n=1 Tax=Desulfuromonas sp. AOP6 TaxID=1566351 RepID=UPI0012715568|nr:16S rRNA (adenine(1518)-N(6)/adenine(1519)-N(6))-dimethyltransferase RsmA [Desulfuromonas sp. AOP6]BCA79676.1 ribosomal RNA small subunit methyltransferase A [Desulfuromonas sp. AOP6]